MPISLDADGRRLLQYLLTVAPNVDPSTLKGLPTYSEAHRALGLPMHGRTWGDSLDRQGMGNVAGWAKDHGYPAVTSFIINGETKRPADGFFRFYDKDPDADLGWWLAEVAASRSFAWPVGSSEPAQAPARISSPANKPKERDLKGAQLVSDIAFEDSRFFLKSEWGPISAYWPALSFSKRSVSDYLNQNYNPAKDFIVYAGTSDPSRTTVPEFRQAILSLLIVEPGEPIPTEKLVPWESLQNLLQDHGKDWPFSFGVRSGWNFAGHPSAKALVPSAYRALGVRSNWGGISEIVGDERRALFSHAIEWVELPNREVVSKTSDIRDMMRDLKENPGLNSAITRMQGLIQGRLGPERQVRTTQPERRVPVGTDLTKLLYEKLDEQRNLCALCGKLMLFDTTKKLLQVSPDRKDSSNPSYGADNLQITHLACNLAKNDGTTEDFEEWMQIISGEEF